MSGIQTLATLVLGGAFDATELGENDIQPDMKLIEELQQRLVTGTDDIYVELINRAELDRVTAERDALQQRLSAADQRIDDQAGLLRRCVMAVREQHCDPDEAEFDLPAGLMADIDAQLSASTEPQQDDDWHMNPCKQGHRDVGAAGGVAECNQCNERIEAATTQEAFERWNATHPATESARSL